MKRVMGIINLYENEELIQEITEHRPLAAVPFAGRYRLIDFTLSSMVNSGIQNVGILLRSKSRSLMDHLRSGKEWDLARKRDGLFILPPAQASSGAVKGNGDIENFYHNLDYIESSRQKYVLISNSHTVCNMNFRKAFQFHENTGADITIVYKEQEKDSEDFTGSTVLATTDDGRVIDLAVNPAKVNGGKISMDMYLMRKELLVDIINGCYARGGVDLLKDGLIKNIDSLKIYGYQHKGFVARINSIASYYRHNMELLKPEKWQELFMKSGLIYTKVKDEAPAKYKENAKISNAMVANGCIIEGEVENSVLFRGVKVNKGACIRNSIIMQKCEIAENAIIENVICDKDVIITNGKWLKGDQRYPLVIEKGTVI
ncbi:glucose-1-phosphate adenylyltransferase subunit GlgD [Dendrosporobacter sp. 1207_IL3150]|uniref:glucose-1-phosphate adenylyltransferase subunit GlgD n=1 Tax=Dendrosporobacter sp. 1207_IL3150 TaxID=3084054 RepID=UPI002FDB5851